MSPDAALPAHTLVYLSGPPGVGKSTLMTELTAGCRRADRATPFAHGMLYGPDDDFRRGGWHRSVAIELGRRRPGYPGTDTLSMSVSPRACAWIAEHPHRLILAEGDRLATRAFLGAASAAGYHVALLNLIAEPETLAHRRDLRGSRQNDAWMKGRLTKCARLADAAEELGWTRFDLDTTEVEPGELGAMALRFVPELRALPAPAPAVR